MKTFLSALLLFFSLSSVAQSDIKEDDRTFLINTLTQISDPVLHALSEHKLKEKMPFEERKGVSPKKIEVMHLEAFGRLMAGLAPWLELGPDHTNEGKLRKKYIDLSVKAFSNAVDPKSPDFMNFLTGGQPLVDAAFLAHALLRAPNQLWGNLPAKAKRNTIEALKATRTIVAHYNNWLLFSAMIEAAILKFDGEADMMRIDYAIMKHLDWYKGDGVFGDGEEFHFDYYNSFVIQPMLLDILKVVKEHGKGLRQSYNVEDTYESVVIRAQRYAEIQERLISPIGTFPPVGRSLVYRFGSFQLLSQMALMKKLPESISPAQVRSALTAVVRKTMEPANTFDENGWLKVGLYGSQPSLGEPYITTGSSYLCSVGLLCLGLPADDEFWSSPAEDWTSKKIWSGEDIKADKALRGK